MKRLFNSKVYKPLLVRVATARLPPPSFLRTTKPPHTMNQYHLQHTIQSPRGSVGTMEFSPSGRFLVVGGGHPARLRVLDRMAGFCPMIEAGAISQPASLAFESSTTFIAGLDDGRFVKYTIDLKSKRLVKEWTNNSLRGPASSVTAIALDGTSEILALAVGPSVFVFIRVPETGEAPHRLLLSRLTLSRRVPVHGQHIWFLRFRMRCRRAPPSPHVLVFFFKRPTSCRVPQATLSVGVLPTWCDRYIRDELPPLGP